MFSALMFGTKCVKMLKCKTLRLHYMSLSQLFDNHIQQILYIHKILAYILCIRIFLLAGVGIGPINPILVGS